MTHTVRTLFLNSFKHGCEYKCLKSCQQKLFLEYSKTLLKQKWMQRGINYDAMKTNNTIYFMCKNLYTFKMILTDNMNMV